MGTALLERFLPADKPSDTPGWSQFLQEKGEPASPLATAYGIKTLLLLGEEPSSSPRRR